MSHFADRRGRYVDFKTSPMTPLRVNKDLSEWPGKNRKAKKLSRKRARLSFLDWKRRGQDKPRPYGPVPNG